MNRQQRSLLAIANSIRAELDRRQQGIPITSAAPVQRWERLIHISRRIERAQRLGWQRAAARLAQDRCDEARYFQPQLDAWLSQLGTQPAPKRLPRGSDLFRDLVALEAEFGEVGFDPADTELFVTTEEIELEGIDLGRFDIRLDLTALDEPGRPYRIVACDPSPAASNEGVTHPHVQNENLCPGSGQMAIARALADWRLYDFFVIVNRILLTYSSGNAFVELSDWGGTPCHDCDAATAEHSRSHCEGCESTLCDNCATSCLSCGCDYCSNCISNCAHCDEYHCAVCLSRCNQCMAAVCSDCREHETLCTKCHEREQADADEAETVASSPPRTGRVRAAV